MGGAGTPGRSALLLSYRASSGAGQGDQGVRAVPRPGEHGQAGGHGAALRDEAGDRVAQLGIHADDLR
jgi:hypothetical protein